jgi:hypothetical protein
VRPLLLQAALDLTRKNMEAGQQMRGTPPQP